MHNRNRNKVLAIIVTLFALHTSYCGEVKAAPVGMMATTAGKLAAVGMILKTWSTIAQRSNREFTRQDQWQILKAFALGMGLEVTDWLRWYLLPEKRKLDIDNELRTDIRISYTMSALLRFFVAGNLTNMALESDSSERKVLWSSGAEGLFALYTALEGLQQLGFGMSFDKA